VLDNRVLRERTKQAWRAVSKRLPPKVADAIRTPTARLLSRAGLIAPR
jgi:peptide subunit release factor 1 (eRF1)